MGHNRISFGPRDPREAGAMLQNDPFALWPCSLVGRHANSFRRISPAEMHASFMFFLLWGKEVIGRSARR
jgi:hypothetical protein